MGLDYILEIVFYQLLARSIDHFGDNFLYKGTVFLLAFYSGWVMGQFLAYLITGRKRIACPTYFHK